MSSSRINSSRRISSRSSNGSGRSSSGSGSASTITSERSAPNLQLALPGIELQIQRLYLCMNVTCSTVFFLTTFSLIVGKTRVFFH